MKQSSKVVTGTFNANTDNLLNRVASLGQGQVSSTLSELVGNAVDAGADTIHIVLVEGTEGRRIVVADNGHGILGRVPEDQARIIAEYIEHANSLDEDIARAAIEAMFSQLNPVYAISFLYMLSSGALSAKSRPDFWARAQQPVQSLWSMRKRTADRPQGTFGIGMTEAWSLGQCHYTSRAFIGLASAGYGGNVQKQNQVPIYQLKAPRFSPNPEVRNRGFEIVEVTGEFLNGFRIPYINVSMEHGTIVEITDLSARINEQYIREHLRDLYGGLIYNGDIRILFYNATVTKTSVKFNSQPKELESIRLIGHPLFEDSPIVIDTEYQGYPYQAVIHLNTVGKEGQPFPPSFVRRGVKKDPVISIPEYFPEVWGHPSLTGLIEIFTPADLVPARYGLGDQNFWDPKKDRPNIANKGIATLLEEINKLTEYIVQRVGEIKESRKAQRTAAINEIVNQAMSRALNSFGDFFTLDTPPKPGVTKVNENPGGGAAGGKDESQPVLPGISVLVLNEHGELSALEFRVRVLDEKGRTAHEKNFKGHVNLDPVSNRQKYRIYLDLPQGVSFALGVQNPQLTFIAPRDHITVRFDVITGEEKRLRRKLKSGLSVVFSPAGQDAGAWSLNHLEQGEIWINSDYPELSHSIDRGDSQGTSFIIGHAIAAALSLAAFGQADNTVMTRQFDLGNKLARSIAEEWQGGQIE